MPERDNFRTEIKNAIEKALEWSKTQQHRDGYWIGRLETNCCMEAEWIMAMHFMGIENDPKMPEVVQAILNEQREDGSWEVYYRAPSGDINTTVECYTALRIAGFPAHDHVLQKARSWILEHGGLSKIRVFTKYWLALMGEWPWQHTPALPPEMIFQPLWFPFNIYHFSSWARATIMPLTILCSRRPVRPLPKKSRLDELFPQGRENFDFRLKRKKGFFSWESLFFAADRILNAYVSFPFKPFRETAIRVCLEWIIKHQDADGVWGGIQPPLIYSLMALHTEGYLHSHPVMAAGLDSFNRHWSFCKNGGRYICASESIVWDTFLTMLAQLDCGLNAREYEPMKRALRWVLDKFVTSQGDWQVKVKGVQPGAWAFERANTWYPGVDDTAVALIVLARLKNSGTIPEGMEPEVDFAMKRALAWIDAMQCKNGGWAAFDQDNYGKLLTKIPFSDFGEALDPPSVDVTGHVLEAMGLMGRDTKHPVVAKAIEYIRQEQEPDGSWFGRWGVNYIYGTAAVLPGLEAVGVDMAAEYIQDAARWIIDHQNNDGGWGESCASYMDDAFRGKGESTASQTAWALMALLAANHSGKYDDTIKKGLAWLLDTQLENGTWDEPWYTGTGFPGYGVGERTDLERARQELEQGKELSRGFMINYNLYRHYFPLMAMGRGVSVL